MLVINHTMERTHTTDVDTEDDNEFNTTNSLLHAHVRDSVSAKKSNSQTLQPSTTEDDENSVPERDKKKYSHPNKAENVPYKYIWIQTLDEFQFLENGNLERAISNPKDPNHIYFKSSELFTTKLDLTLSRAKSFRHLKDLKFDSSAKSKEILGSEHLASNIKSILYKIIPTAIRTFIENYYSFIRAAKYP